MRLRVLGAAVAATAAVVIAPSTTPAQAAPAATTGRHCVVDVQAPAAPACYGSLSAALSRATGGEVSASNALSGSAADLDATVNAANARSAGARSLNRAAAASIVIGIEYSGNNFSGSSLIYNASHTCDNPVSPREFFVNTLPSGWNDDIESFRAYANCAAMHYLRHLPGRPARRLVHQLGWPRRGRRRGQLDRVELSDGCAGGLPIGRPPVCRSAVPHTRLAARPDVDDRDLRSPIGKPAPRVHHHVVALGEHLVDLDLHAREPFPLGRRGGARPVVDEVLAEEGGKRIDVARLESVPPAPVGRCFCARRRRLGPSRRAWSRPASPGRAPRWSSDSRISSTCRCATATGRDRVVLPGRRGKRRLLQEVVDRVEGGAGVAAAHAEAEPVGRNRRESDA